MESVWSQAKRRSASMFWLGVHFCSQSAILPTMLHRQCHMQMGWLCTLDSCVRIISVGWCALVGWLSLAGSILPAPSLSHCLHIARGQVLLVHGQCPRRFTSAAGSELLYVMYDA